MGTAGRVTLVVMLAVAIVLLWHFTPGPDDGFQACGFRAITGHRCPGCGATHALHHLLHGRILEAFQHNALVLLAPPLMMLQAVVARRWPKLPNPLAPMGLAIWAMVAAIWAIWREWP
ncbi:MAG: DUF2752 domain-containing protein [Flavobacteriales bacterium]|nr:DUF2752 domain-containing protein [Flavobacteriales bacterium]